MSNREFRLVSKIRGAVLLVSMVFLLLMALVAGTVMQTSVLEFRMAGNDQFREEAFQKVQAIASAISENEDNFPIVGDIGYTVCDAADGHADCNTDGNNIAIDSSVTSVPSGVSTTYRIRREGPWCYPEPPFRLSQAQASSDVDFALFETTVDYDGSSVRLGNAEIAVGVLAVSLEFCE